MRRNQWRKPHRYKRKKSILRSRFFWFWILIFFFVGAVFYFLFLSETFQAEKIVVAGQEKASKEEIERIMEGKLENRIFFFPTRSIFSVCLIEAKEEILSTFPQIAEVEIKRSFPDVLNVLVKERSGSAVWCQKDKCFLLDNEGIIFEETSPETDLVKIINQQNVGYLLLGEKVIDKDSLSRILSIASELKDNLEIPIKEFIISAREELTVLTIEGWQIYFNLEEDLEWQLTKLNVVLEEKVPPESRKDLEYIDVRFGNLAPLKYGD
jgi:cell division septal protein FtsQ